MQRTQIFSLPTVLAIVGSVLLVLFSKEIKININLNFLFINNDLISGNGFQCYKCMEYEDCYENGNIGSVDKCDEGINACVIYTLEEGKLCPKT